MSYVLKSRNVDGLTYVHSNDAIGDVTIRRHDPSAGPGTEPVDVITVPAGDLVRLVSEWVRREWIWRIENLDPPSLVGLYLRSQEKPDV